MKQNPFHNLKERMKYYSISRRLIVLSYLILTPFLLLISAFMTWSNYRVHWINQQERYVQETVNLCETIDTMLTRVIDMGTYISINDNIIEILSSRKQSTQGEDSQRWLTNAPMQILEDMLAIDGDMRTIGIYPENGTTPYLRCMDLSSYLPTLEEVRETAIYQEAVQDGRVFLWQRVGKGKSDTFAASRTEKIVMYREIFDMSQKNMLGYIVLGSSAEHYDEVCRSAAETGGEVVLISRNDAELVREGKLDAETVDAVIENLNLESMESLADDYSDKSIYMDTSLGREQVYVCESSKTGVKVVRMVEPTSWMEMAASVFAGPLALLLGLLLGMYPLFKITTNRVITRPLSKLTQAMRKFRKGDFEVQVEVMHQDEVGEASAGFNKMVRDMKTLIDRNYVLALREKESELDILQAQINPHFLYNTLDSLYWRVMDTGNEDVAEDILALSDLFRLELGRGEGIVTAEHEFNLLSRYLQIQKMRFEDRLNYTLSLSPEAREGRIPKLILQPFVENAIVHGFEKGKEDFRLEVTAVRIGEELEFRITDTGVGMTQEQVDTLFVRADDRKVAGQRVGRYAIRNVRERLEIKYSGRYRLEITSRPGEGTSVLIRIPWEEEKQ